MKTPAPDAFRQHDALMEAVLIGGIFFLLAMFGFLLWLKISDRHRRKNGDNGRLVKRPKESKKIRLK
jgi:hypothetical protein